MSDHRFNKYRAAVDVLNKGRDALVEGLAEDVLSQADDLLEGGFLFNEFLETQGTRLHFLMLLVQQLESSAETFDEASAAAELAMPAPAPKPKPKRKPRAKKLPQNASAEGTGTNPEEL